TLGSGTATGSHIFAGPGAFTIVLTVTDKDGGAASETFVVNVNPSIFILNPTASGALSVSGNASINLPGVVEVDSNSSSAIQISGNASITAARIDVVGKVSANGKPTLSPAPHTGISPIPDPLSTLAAPTSGTDRGSVNLGGNTALTINPGIYSQITVSGNA